MYALILPFSEVEVLLNEAKPGILHVEEMPGFVILIR